MWTWTLVEQLRLDLRYALRMMRTDRVLTALAIVTLALGIGANTAIFSVINTLMLRPLPVRAPHELVQMFSTLPGDPMRVAGFPWRFYERFRDHNSVFADLIGTTTSRFAVSREGLDAERVEGAHVTGNLFSALGVTPAAGRLIGPQDDRLGDAGAAVAVLSWSCWQSRFNLDPAIVGKSLTIDGVPVTVIGVAPRGFFGLAVGLKPDVWLPAAAAPMLQAAAAAANANASASARAGANASGNRQPAALDRLTLGLMGRLKPGVSLAQAQAEISVLNQWRVEELAKASTNPTIRQSTLVVAPAGQGLSVLQDLWGRALFTLMAVVCLVLFVACLNVAIMLLARSAARQREMAVRVSLGAGRWRLVRQVLTESLLMSGVASLLGLVVAYVGANALVRSLASGRPMPGLPERLAIDIPLDLHVLLFTAAAAALTGLLFGMAPAWSAFSSAPVSLLRHAGETKSRRLFGKSLVVAQVGLSVVLLSAAGLFVGHLSNLRDVELGLRRESTLLVTLEPAGAGYSRQQLTVLYRELLDRLDTIPGVRAATLSGISPVSGAGWSRLVDVEGFHEAAGDRRYVSLNAVAPKYFETYGTPLLAGRDFEVEDEGRPRVAIVNQAMARYYFGDGNPLGRHVTVDGEGGPYEIVGVAGNAKYSDPHEAVPRTLYLHAFQDGRIGSQFALRTSTAPAAVAADVRRVVTDVLKTVKVGKMTTLAEQVDASLVPERLLAALSGLFGALGALLAAIGLYGLLAYTVTRRAHEIGVRMALGATRGDVTRMVLNGALALVFAGLVAGVPLSILSKRLAMMLVEGVSAGSPFPIGAAAASMIIVGLLASYIPARRAARVEPRDALRHD
jgi:predicted permease